MKTLFLGLALLLCHRVQSQDKNFWHTLAQVGFETRKDKNGYEMEVPVFGKYLQTFQGKKIHIKGYMIPLSESGGKGKFMLSSLPYSLCFFCGAAGPETVVEIETDEKLKFVTKPIVMEGILLLNATDAEHHMYVLQSANKISELN